MASNEDPFAGLREFLEAMGMKVLSGDELLGILGISSVDELEEDINALRTSAAHKAVDEVMANERLLDMLFEPGTWIVSQLSARYGLDGMANSTIASELKALVEEAREVYADRKSET